MTMSRWLPAALALSLAPGLALAQDRTADPTKSAGTEASKDTATMQGATGRMAEDAKTRGVEVPKMKADDKDDDKTKGDDAKDMKGSKYTLWKLHQANQMEIQMSQLALTNATSKEVKGFAQKMIADHKGADAKVSAQAKKIDADLDEKPSAADKAEMDEAMTKMDQMKSAKGPDFDSQFVKQMTDDHQKVIDLVTTASKDPDQKDIQPLLTQLLPKLQQHGKMAMRLADGHGGMAGKAGDSGSMKMHRAGKSMDSGKDMGAGKDLGTDKDMDSSKDKDSAKSTDPKKGPKDMDATNPK